MVTIADIAGTMSLEGDSFLATLDRAEARVEQFEATLARLSSGGSIGLNINGLDAATSGLNAIAQAEQLVTQNAGQLTAAESSITSASQALLGDIQAAAQAGEAWATTMLADAQAMARGADAATVLSAAASDNSSTIQQLAGAMVEQQQAAEAAAAAVKAETDAEQAQTPVTAELAQTQQQAAAATQDAGNKLDQTTPKHRAYGSAASQSMSATRDLSRATQELAGQIPGLGTSLNAVVNIFSAGEKGMRAANDEGLSFTQTTAIMGAGMTAAGAVAATGFFGVFDSGLTTLRNLATVAGLTIPQVAGLQATFQSAGLPAEQTQQIFYRFSGALEQMQNQLDKGQEPTGRQAEAFKSLGINVTDSSGRVQTMGAVLPQIMDRFHALAGGVDESGQKINLTGIAAELFGARIGGRLVPALEEGSGAWDSFTQKADQAGIGSAEQVQRLEALHQASANTSLELKGMALAIGSDVAPAFTKGIELAGDLASWMGKLPAPVRDMVVTFPLAAGGVLLLVSAGSGLIGVIGTLSGSTAQLMALLSGTATSAESLAAAEAIAANEASIAAGAITEEAVAIEAADAATASLIPGVGLLVAGVTAAVVGITAWISSNNDAADSEKKLSDATRNATKDFDDQITALGKQGMSTQAIYAQLQGTQAQYTQQLDQTGAAMTTVNARLKDQAAQLVETNAGLSGMTTEQVQDNDLLSRSFYDTLQALQLTDTEYVNLQKAFDDTSTKLHGLDPDIAKLSQDLAGTATAADQAKTHLDSLIDKWGLGTSSALANATATEKLESAVRSSSQTTAAGVAFAESWSNALGDAALSGEDWTRKLADLTEISKGSNNEAAAGAKAEIEYATAVRALTPAVAEAVVAQAQAEDTANRLSSVQRQLAGDIRTTAQETIKFNEEMGKLGPVVQSAAGQAAQDFIDKWSTAMAAVRQDDETIQAAITNNASAEEVKRLQDKRTSDQDQADDFRQSAQDQITTAQQTSAIINQVNQQLSTENKKISDDTLAYHQKIAENDIKLAHLTTEERTHQLDVWLTAENTTMQAIMRLYDDLQHAGNFAARAITQAFIAAAQEQLRVMQGEAQIAQSAAGADTKQDKADTTAQNKAAEEAKKAAQEQFDLTKNETTAQNDYNAALKAGLDIQKQQLDVQKQVKDGTQQVTQIQVDALHANTEASRGTAQAALDATSTAQRAWEQVASTIDVATGLSWKYSQNEVDAAKAAYSEKKDYSDLYLRDFQQNLQLEQAASQQLEQQQAAAAQAQKTYADARRQDATAEVSATNTLLDSYQKFTQTVAISQVSLKSGADSVGQHMVESAHSAALGAQNAYEDANRQVLADQRALTAEMAPETRKRLQAQLDADTAVKDSAQSTASTLKTIYDRDAAAFENAEQKKVAAALASRTAQESAADAWSKVADAAYTAYNNSIDNAISENSALVQNSISTQASIISANTAANQASVKSKHETNAQLAALDREQAALEQQLAAAEQRLGEARAQQIIAQANLKQAQDQASVQSAINAAQAQANIAGQLAQQSAKIASLNAQLMVALAAQSDQDIVKSAQARTDDLVNLQLAQFSAVQLTEPAIAQIQLDVDNARISTGTDRTNALIQLENDWVHAAVNAASITFDAYASAARAEGADAADLAMKRIQFEDDWATAAQKAANVVIEATNKATGSKTKDIDVTGAHVTDILAQIAAASVAIDTHIGDTSVHVSQAIMDAAHAADTAVNAAAADVGNLTNALAGLNQQRAAIDTAASTDTGGGAFGAKISMPSMSAGPSQQSMSGTASAATSLTDAETALADAQQALTDATMMSTHAYADFSSAISGNGSTVGTADAQYALFTRTLGEVQSGTGILGQRLHTTKEEVKGLSDEIKGNADLAKQAADAYASWTSELGVSAKVSLSAEERYRNIGRLLDDVRTSASMAQDAMDSLLGQSSTEEVQQQADLADVNVKIADYNAMVANGGKANQPMLDALNKQQALIQANINQFKAHREALQAHVTAQEAAAGATTLTMDQMSKAYAHFESNSGTLLKRVGGHWDDVIGNIKKGADEMETASSAMVTALSQVASEMDKVASSTEAVAKANADMVKSMQDAQKQSQGSDGGGGGGDIAILSSGMVPGRGSATSGGGQGLNSKGFGMTSFQHGGIKHGDGIAYLHDGEIIINPHEPVPGPNQGGLHGNALGQPIQVMVDLRGSTVPQDPRTMQELVRRGVREGVNEALTRGATMDGVRFG